MELDNLSKLILDKYEKNKIKCATQKMIHFLKQCPVFYFYLNNKIDLKQMIKPAKIDCAFLKDSFTKIFENENEVFERKDIILWIYFFDKKIDENSEEIVVATYPDIDKNTKTSIFKILNRFLPTISITEQNTEWTTMIRQMPICSKLTLLSVYYKTRFYDFHLSNYIFKLIKEHRIYE